MLAGTSAAMAAALVTHCPAIMRPRLGTNRCPVFVAGVRLLGLSRCLPCATVARGRWPDTPPRAGDDIRPTGSTYAAGDAAWGGRTHTGVMLCSDNDVVIACLILVNAGGGRGFVIISASCSSDGTHLIFTRLRSTASRTL